MIILIKFENETIFRETQNSDIEFVTNAIFAEFPRSSFFIIDNEYLKVYQYVKGSLKFKTEFNCGLFMIFDKYPEFITDELISLCYEFPFDYDDYLSHIDDIKEGVSKPIVIDKWKYKIGIFDFDNIINKMDPTHNQKYLNWCLHINYTTSIMDEDYDKTYNMLTDFDNPQVKSLIKKAGYSIDIMSYETVNDLFKVLNECYYSKLDDVEAGDRKILYEKRKIFEFRNWIVVTPKIHAEAVTIGRNTNWCTSGDSEEGAKHFKNYTEKFNFEWVKESNDFYDLFIFINKDNETQKFQWAELTGDFLNWNDEDFEVNKYFDAAFVEEYIYAIGKISFKFKQFLGQFFKDKYFNYFILTLPESNLIMDIRNGDTEVVDILLDNTKDLTYGVKYELIKNKYGLDIFINDDDADIKIEVAKKGYGLDVLINDSSWNIRYEIASQGYGLDVLINDTSFDVRMLIASMGYGLDVLNYDDHYRVVEVVEKTLKKIEKGKLKPYINDYGFKCYK